MARMLSSVSMVCSDVSSTLPRRNFFTSTLSFSGTFSAIIFFTASSTAFSSTLRSYFLNACSYLLGPYSAASFFVFSACCLMSLSTVFFIIPIMLLFFPSDLRLAQHGLQAFNFSLLICR